MAITFDFVEYFNLGSISREEKSVSMTVADTDMIIIGLTSNNTSGELPFVKFGNTYAKPVNGASVTNGNTGNLTLYSVKNPVAGPVTITVSSHSYHMGEVALSVTGFSGVTGDIGRTWTAEQINTGPAYVPPVLDTTPNYPSSMRCIFGAAYFGDSDIVVPSGYTDQGKNFESNTATFVVTSDDASSPDEITIDSSDYIPVLWAGIEIADVAIPNPVEVETTFVQSFPLGFVASATDIKTFNVDLGGADMLLVGVQTQYGGIFPTITFDGVPVKPVSFSKYSEDELGSVGAYALKAPATGTKVLRIVPPQDMGVSNITVIGLSNTSGDFGKNWTLRQSSQNSDMIINEKNSTKSLSVVFGGVFYDSREVHFPDGWEETPIAEGSRTYPDGVKNYSIVGAIGVNGNYMTPNLQIETDAYTQAVYTCVEIYDSTTALPESPIEVFPQTVIDFGWLAASSKTQTVTLQECDFLLVCMVWNNERYPPATLYMNGNMLHKLEDSRIFYDDSNMEMYVVSGVEAGEYDFLAQGYSEAAGQYLVSMIGVNNTSGQTPVRLQGADVTYNMHFELPEPKNPNNVYVAFNSAHWQKEKPTMTSYGWDIVNTGEHPRQDYNVSSYVANSRYGGTAEFMRDGFESQKTILFEFQSLRNTATNTGTSSVVINSDIVKMEGNKEWLDAKDKKLSIHWDSWGELYANVMNPDSFFLTHLPPYIDEVALCFMRPLCSYKTLDDNIAQVSSTPHYGKPGSASLDFEGTGHQFKAMLDLLRKRRPDITITLVVQQLSVGENAQVGMTPYSHDGFGGMTEEHFLNIRKFCEDMGITSLDIDYECVVTDPDLIASGDPTWWCWYDDNDYHSCYTDNEYRWVVKEFRKYFPRPKYTIKLDCWHIGAYFGPYRNEWEPWWVAGFCHCLTEERDPEAFAAFDGINIMSFDLPPNQYNVVRALEAFIYHFPGKAIKPAVRTGAAWGSTPDYNRTLGEYANIANASVKLGGAGTWIYSLLWDIQSRNDFTQPFSVEYPSGQMKAQMIGNLYGKRNTTYPLVTNGFVAPLIPQPKTMG